MVKHILKELEDTWGFSTEELQAIKDAMEDLGSTCYHLGYTDREEETKYHAGFSYGKKEDMVDQTRQD